MWAGPPHNPCRLECLEHFKAGDKIRSRPHVDRVVTQHLPLRGVPTASMQATPSEVGHK